MNEHSRSAFLTAQLESLKQERPSQAHLPSIDLQPWILGIGKDVSERYGRFADLDIVVLDDTPAGIDEQHFICLLKELMDNAFRYSGQDTPVQIAWFNLGCAHLYSSPLRKLKSLGVSASLETYEKKETQQ